MKRTLICTAAALAILWAGSITLAKDATNQKTTRTQKQTTETKDVKKATTPAQQKVDAAKKAFETEIAPWKEVRKVAEEEKATKTIAAIDKIVKAKEDAFKKEMVRLEKQITTNAGPADANKATSKPTDKKPTGN